MSNPYDPYPGQQPPQPQPQPQPQPWPQQQPQQPEQQWQQPPADPAAPTQFVPVGAPPAGQVPQAPAQPGYGAPQDAPAWGQQSGQYGAPQQPGFGAPPQQPYGAPQPPQFGAPPQTQFGVPPQAQYVYPTPVSAEKAKRGGGARVVGAVLGTALGRLAIVVVIAAGIGIYHYATNDSAQRNNNGQVTKAGTLNVQDLQIGDCFDRPSETAGVTTVTAIPCGQAHDSQIYAEPKITESAFPGATAVEAEAKADCAEQGNQVTITPAPPSGVGINVYFPEDETTFDSGTNYISCALYSPSPDLTQSYVSGS